MDEPSPGNRLHEPNVIVLRFAVVGMLSIVVLIVGAMLLAYGWLSVAERPPAAEPPDVSLPPEPLSEPRLDADESATLAEFRAAEDTLLNSYEWLDDQQSVARIPIDRAVQILAEHGLPQHQPEQSNAAPAETE
jgi:hypothetical protein